MATLLAYVATLHRSVAGGDSGELVAAVATGGVPHPPGYPLYALLTSPFTWLPLHNVAWRANLGAAVFAAVAAALLAWCATRMTGRWWAGIAAGGLFAFAPTVWLYATSAEVFALNNALVAAQLCLFAAVDREPRRRLVYAGAFVVGLGISNHHTSVVFTFVLLAGMLWRTRATWRSARVLAALAGCGALGLLPYAYLPIASMRHPPIEWGDTGSVQGFINHFMRRDYGTFRLAADTATARMSTAQQLGYYVRDLVHQVSWVGVALGTWGLAYTTWRRETRVFGITTFAAFVAFLLVFHSLANLPLADPLIHGVVARFWLAPNLLVCLWAGLGVSAITVVPLRAQAALAIAVAIVTFVLHAPRALRDHNDSIVHDYGASILRAAPPNALILTRGDLITNTTRYLHTVEHMRSDVRILDVEMLTFAWMTRQVERGMPELVLPGAYYGVRDSSAYVIADLIAANIPRRPVLICGAWKPGDTSGSTAYRGLPIGLCDRLVPATSTVNADAWAAESRASLPQFRNDMRVVPATDTWEYVVWIDYWEAHHRRAYTFLMLALERADDPALLRHAAESFEDIIMQHPAAPAAWYKNLGVARGRLAATDAASAPLAVNAFQHYLQYGSAEDTDRARIEQTIKELGGR